MTLLVSRRTALSSLVLVILPAISGAQTFLDPAMSSVLVTASRAPQAAIDVLADHVVIGAEEIDRSGAANIIDLLRQQRAIEVTRNGGPGANSTVFIRGADGKQNVVLVDGVRVGSSTSGAANWTTLPLANVERIEIVYGPLATMYGADAIGGVVQIFTRRGNGPARVYASAGAGSRGARMMDAAVAGSTQGEHALSYAFSLAHAEDDGFSSTRPGLSSHNPDKDGYDRDTASANVSMRLGANSEAGIIYLHSHLKSQYDSGASNFDTRSIQNQDNIAAYARHQVTPSWKLQLQVAESADESTNITSASPAGTNRIKTRQNFYTLQNDIAFGADLLQLILERRVEEVVSNTSASLTRSRATNSLAAAYSFKRGPHLATASVRADDRRQDQTKITGGLGYGYRIGPALRANASVGTSFRAPTFNELYFAGYGVASNRPERGRNAEGGLYYKDGATSASVVYFHNRLTDLLVNLSRCPVEVSTHPAGCAYNVNRATLTGVSAAAAHRLGSFELRATLDWQDPVDATTGKQLVRRARRHGTLGAHYKAGALTTGATLLFSSRRFDDTANRNALAGYALLNLHASYAFAPGWSALLRWNNATDKQYELARNYGTAGSTVFAGVRYGLN